jgi:hypothetical protein
VIALTKTETKEMPVYNAAGNLLQNVKLTFHTYSGETEAEAKGFLQSLSEIPRYIYYAVEVGDHAYCRDYLGYYEEMIIGRPQECPQ